MKTSEPKPTSSPICLADVSEFTGFKSICGKPAEWILCGMPRCGRHCSSKWKKANREPITNKP